jgi:uracil phosphoribosyltransferase
LFYFTCWISNAHWFFLFDAEKRFYICIRYHPNNDDHFEISVEYQAIADFNNKYLLLVDPMLATGQSIIAVFNRLMEEEAKEIHIAVVIAAPEGHTLKNTCLTLVIFGLPL